MKKVLVYSMILVVFGVMVGCSFGVSSSGGKMTIGFADLKGIEKEIEVKKSGSLNLTYTDFALEKGEMLLTVLSTAGEVITEKTFHPGDQSKGSITLPNLQAGETYILKFTGPTAKNGEIELSFSSRSVQVGK